MNATEPRVSIGYVTPKNRATARAGGPVSPAPSSEEPVQTRIDTQQVCGPDFSEPAGAVAAVASIESMPPPYLLLKELQYRRITYIREINALENRGRAMLRRALGFSTDLPEVERAKLTRRAELLHTKILAGENAFDAQDAPAANALMADILLFDQLADQLKAARNEIEKAMKKAARASTLWTEFAAGIKGFGELALAVTLAESGDPLAYGTVSRFWKRLGLAVIDGERQQCRSDPDLAALHGYSPRRRAEIFAVLADPLFRHQWAGAREDRPAGPKGPYGEVYAREKAKAAPRVAATEPLPFTDKQKWTPKRVDAHARRLMTKALLRDLWRAARGLPPRGASLSIGDDV